MARLIKIPADGDQPLEVVDVPELTYPQLNDATVGSGNLVEGVRPKGFTHLADETEKRVLSFIVDEEGFAHDLALNTRASLLYGTHVHGQPIVGDAWILAEYLVPGEGWTWGEVPEVITVETINLAILRAYVNTDIFE
jgi:hypothetical protein